ncbi:TIR domain-containing protein [Pseudonocardia humida]|uniref:TIR domain-containing protein n=1 Tax=Pseudonocardia humida TaxID=2800819 RepID=A0ABT1A2N4_9PSEU|nr:TIR domain-containing protein [Pseudonocardia humida]MCO1657134.1 TIR domain-containing protein [Pseudonocardia humida]
MIFVSFRDESAHSAGRLGHLLGERFGSKAVFLADSVVVSSDTAADTDSALRQCKVAIVVVDPTWTTAADAVIRQVGTLLERGIEILPVLVDGARPLRADDLPESMRRLARLQAVRLDHVTFRADAEQVAEWVDTAIRGERSPPSRRPRERRPAPPDRPVPLLRTLRRIVLWWIVFLFAINTGISLFRLVLGPDQPRLLGGTIALTVVQILLLGCCILVLRREIAAERLMIDRAGPAAKSSSAGRATSRGRVGLITGACIVVAMLIGWSVASAP